jgi:hypothetical protein
MGETSASDIVVVCLRIMAVTNARTDVRSVPKTSHKDPAPSPLYFASWARRADAPEAIPVADLNQLARFDRPGEGDKAVPHYFPLPIDALQSDRTIDLQDGTNIRAVAELIVVSDWEYLLLPLAPVQSIRYQRGNVHQVLQRHRALAAHTHVCEGCLSSRRAAVPLRRNELAGGGKHLFSLSPDRLMRILVLRITPQIN